LQTIPNVKDTPWTKEIYKALKVTFTSIYRFLVKCKVLLQKANHIENVIEKETLLCLVYIVIAMSIVQTLVFLNQYAIPTYWMEHITFFKMAMSKMFNSIPCQICQTMFALMQLSYHQRRKIKCTMYHKYCQSTQHMQKELSVFVQLDYLAAVIVLGCTVLKTIFV